MSDRIDDRFGRGQRARALCKDMQFQVFMGARDEVGAAMRIATQCSASTFEALDLGSYERHAWDMIESSWRARAAA